MCNQSMQKMVTFKGGFASQTGSLFIKTVIGYVLAYLYLVFMGRALGLETFGTTRASLLYGKLSL